MNHKVKILRKGSFSPNLRDVAVLEGIQLCLKFSIHLAECFLA